MKLHGEVEKFDNNTWRVELEYDFISNREEVKELVSDLQDFLTTLRVCVGGGG